MVRQDMNTTFFISDKITLILDSQLSKDNLLELKYWKLILEKLMAKQIDNYFSNVHFYLVFGNQPINMAMSKDVLNVFLIADERQTLQPTIYNGSNIVFQSSYTPAKFGNVYSKLFAFPVGYNGELDFSNPVPFSERSVNVFFSGNLHRGRRRMFKFYSYLRYFPFFLQHRLQEKIKSTYDDKYPNSYIRFTNGFMRGLNFEEYANYIKNSKIVLTPHGSVVEECFRHYEAMKCGCVIISERLPENHFFSGSPIIQIDDWKEADKIIKELLENPDRMQELHIAALQWWKDVMSESAVADYMADIISKNQIA
ncbi:glycosyltransferase family protein [Hymenobacter terricola]|uniref:glycosyltransferase family protein n=1 Tax=Hymenobacter terricola TaxID=2819236 RepID=UPI001B30E6C7|nr:glycosyltransferase [Hymenobacter terricola]